MSLFRRRRARRHVERGAQLVTEQRFDEALVELEHAAALTPGDWRIWYDLGLLHKWRREWQRSRDCNRAAVELGGDVSAHWNLGIAATAVRDWAAARRAWRHVGLAVPDGDGPIEVELGLCVIRLRAVDRDRAETVWCDRMDPARARVANIPLVETGHRWRDIVLHDAEPAGIARGPDRRKIAVFDELERLEPSPFITWRATVIAPLESDVADLVDRFDEPQRAAEDWTETIHPQCEACRRGEPDGAHDHRHDDEWRVERSLAFAARSRGEVEGRLEAWARDRRGRAWRRLDGGD